MITQSKHLIPAAVLMGLFIISMLSAKFYFTKKMNKYFMALLSYAIFVFVVEYCEMPYVYTIVINKWTFLLISYILLLEDYFFPILVGAHVSVKMILLIPTKVKSGEIPREHILGNFTGIMMTAVLLTVLYHLFGKLLAERNKFRELSITDSLTGLATFAYTIETANEMLRQGPVSVLITDMDRFKQVNDTYGHIAGNKVLVEVAEFIHNETKGLDRIIGRLGGDEFIIVVRNDNSDKILGLGERLYEVMKDKLFQVDPELDPINLSFSIGQSNSSSKDKDIEKLIHDADINMYYNKYRSHRLNIFINKERPSLPKEGYELLNVLAEKDMYTYVHSGYTAQYAAALAKELGFQEEKIDALYTAGWLHDMGKILVSSDIVRKNSSLTHDEYLLIKNHVRYGLNVLKDLELPKDILNCIKYHHECWDGSGYPNKLVGEEIPMEARLLQLVDSYSAMIIKRVYRTTLTPEDALQEIEKNSGKQFDPKLVEVFARLIKQKLEVA